MVKYLSIHNSSLALRYFLMEMARPLLYIFLFLFFKKKLSSFFCLFWLANTLRAGPSRSKHPAVHHEGWMVSESWNNFLLGSSSQTNHGGYLSCFSTELVTKRWNQRLTEFEVHPQVSNKKGWCTGGCWFTVAGRTLPYTFSLLSAWNWNPTPLKGNKKFLRVLYGQIRK